MPVFLDANVYLYAAGAPGPYKDACVSILRAAADTPARLDATTNTEVIQEILHVLARRGDIRVATAVARNALAQTPNPLPVTGADLEVAMDLLRGTPALPVRDAIHAATMIRARIGTVVSADYHFDRIPGIDRVDPADRHAVARLLR